MFKPKTIAFLTAVALVVPAASASAATPDAPWSATGTGTTVATSNGTTTDPVLDYSVAGSSGSWTFSATSKSTRQQPVSWRYKGYHAWFQVRVKIEKFVVRGGREIATETLSAAGPVNCCAAPSGGFDYTGTTTFDLQAGDVYGFRMSGSHVDRDRRLIGNLSLTVPQPDLNALLKTVQDRFDARAAQIEQLSAELAAANAAGDAAKASQLMAQLQTLMQQNHDDAQRIASILKEIADTRDSVIGKITP